SSPSTAVGASARGSFPTRNEVFVAEDLSGPQAKGTGEEIITAAEELGPCCEYLAACPQIGFDTEFVGEETYHPRLCLIQVATPERLFLIDPLTVGPLDAFWKLIVDPKRVTVVH